MKYLLIVAVAVVIAFFICWAPFHVQRLIAIYGTNTEDHMTSNGPWMEYLYLLITYVSGVLYYVSTTINPILYNIMSNKFRMAFMETLSKSCRLPGLPARNEQRSYSSLSRSQQRTVGPCNSRTAGTGGASCVMPESMEGSGNSGEDSQKQAINNPENLPKSIDIPDVRANSMRKEHTKETRNNNDIAVTKNNLQPISGHNRCEGHRGRDRSIRRNQDTTWSKRTRYKSVKMPNANASEKKWWRFLKWLPGLKDLKFPGRSTVAENHESGNCPREELSMTMWNIRDDNEQRPA